MARPRHRRPSSGRSRTRALVALLALLASASSAAFSSASFTSASSNPGNVVRAADDWTPPTVSLRDPGSPVSGTVTLTADASDAETGIRDVVLEYAPAGTTTWTAVCTDTTAPYSCTWDTRALAEGSYDLRARATDGSGLMTTSAVRRTTLSNTLTVVLANPGDALRGSVVLNATVHNPGLLPLLNVRIQYAPAGTTTWTTICTDTLAPWSCTWATTGVANGDYDLRAVATDTLGRTYVSETVPDVTVDNLAPTVTLADPGSPLAGTITLSATASDAHSGVDRVLVQSAPAGTTTWTTLCTVTAAPYSCRYDTTALAGGTYDLRAVAFDVAGNSTTSATVRNRVVDNTVDSVSMEDPGAFLNGTVTLVATANAATGVSSVRIQRAVSGTTTWTDVCTDTVAPYSCAWDSRTVTDGLYDFRAVLVSGSGRTTTSAAVTQRRVDNTPVRGADVQAANGGATVSRLEAGDSLTLTYTEQMQPGTILSGWDGSARAVVLRGRDGTALGLANKDDTLDVLVGGAVIGLGSVNLKEDYLKGGKTVTFNATMTAGTVTVSGTVRTTVRIVLGAVASGTGLKTAGAAGTMVWSPSSAARDLSGNACSTAPTTETGTLDRDV